MYSKENPKVTDDQILGALEMYEMGATVSRCIVFLGVSRCTFQTYLGNWSRMSCYMRHIKKYPNGRVANYRGKRPMNRG